MKFVTNLKASVMATALICYGATLGFTVADSIVGGAVKAKLSDAADKINRRMTEKKYAAMATADEKARHEWQAMCAKRHKDKDAHRITFADSPKVSSDLLNKLKNVPSMSMKDLERGTVME